MAYTRTGGSVRLATARTTLVTEASPDESRILWLPEIVAGRTAPRRRNDAPPLFEGIGSMSYVLLTAAKSKEELKQAFLLYHSGAAEC